MILPISVHPIKGKEAGIDISLPVDDLYLSPSTFSELTKLDLSQCPDLKDEDLPDFSSLEMLRSLNLSNLKNITSTALRTIKDLPSLKSLNVTNCVGLIFDEQTYIQLSKIYTLQKIYLCIRYTEEKPITSEPIPKKHFISKGRSRSDLANELRRRSKKRISNYEYKRRKLPSSFEKLTSLYKLKYLDLSGCYISDQQLLSLKYISNLEFCNLHNCTNLTDAAIEKLCNNFSNLEVIR